MWLYVFVCVCVCVCAVLSMILLVIIRYISAVLVWILTGLVVLGSLGEVTSCFMVNILTYSNLSSFHNFSCVCVSAYLNVCVCVYVCVNVCDE